MKGTHSFILETSKIRYELEIKYKFSIFKGESGSGKTALCQQILKKGNMSARATGISIHTDLKYVVLTDETLLDSYLERSYNLFFIDEDVVDGICKSDIHEIFSETLKESDAYFIFMSRNALLLSVLNSTGICYELVEEYRENSSIKTLVNVEAPQQGV